jgi:predicted CXXCH cytochrome family protein
MARLVKPLVLIVVVLLVLSVPAAAVVLRSYILAPTAQAKPSQPIDFPHSIHVQAVGLQCTFCHREVTTTANATLPALQLCMQCHSIIPTQDRPQLQKLVAAYQDNQAIDWNRVHQLPDHVHFVHAMHINAGFTCSTCHGDVWTMTTVQQVRDLRMGDCITCHRENNARTDCAACHY